MKKKCLLKLVAGMMAAVMTVSVPVSAAEQMKDAAPEEGIVGAMTEAETVDDAAVDGEEQTAPASGAKEEEQTAPASETKEEEGSQTAPDADKPEENDGEPLDVTLPEVSEEEGSTPAASGEETPAAPVGSNIKWSVSGDGVLTVECAGDPYDPEGADDYFKVPWLKEDAGRIKSARVTLTDCTKLDHLFDGCVGLTEIDLGATDAAKVTSAADVFKGCTALEKVILPKNLQIGLELPALKSLAGKVEAAYGNIDWTIDEEGALKISGKGNYADPANVEGFRAPWQSYAERITQAEVELTECTTLKGMFQGCVNIVHFELGKLNTSMVTDMSFMFKDCKSVYGIYFHGAGDPEPHYDTGKVTTMESMFEGCENIGALWLSMFDMSQVTNVSRIFDGCPELYSIEAPKIIKSEIPLPVSESCPEWYINDYNFTAVKAIPVTENEGSVALYKSLDLISPYDAPAGINRYYARRLGEDMDRTKLVKDFVWIADFDENSLMYTGSAIAQDVKVYYRDTRLNKGTDYTLTYKNNIAANGKDSASAPQITISLKGQITGTRSVPFSILPADISAADVSIEEAAVSYNGKMQMVKPKVVYNGKTLKKGKDYAVTYEGDAVGSAAGISEVQYTIRGMGNFSSDSVAVGKYYIIGADHNLSKAAVTYDKSVKYDGTPIKAEQLGISVRLNGVEVDPANYIAELKNFDNSGTGKIIISPSDAGLKEGYRGRLVKTCKVAGALNFKQTVSLNTNTWKAYIPYSRTLCSGGGIRQGDALLTDGSAVLTEGVDYTVKYTNNRKKGTAKATFKGLGKYNGTFSKTFKITPAETVTVAIADTTEYAKNGAVPDIEVRDAEGFLLTEKKDYTVKCAENKYCGTAVCTIKGKGNYKFLETKSFTVTQAVLTDDCIVAPDKAAAGGGTTYKITPTLYDKRNGKKLKAGTDYSTSYEYQKKEKDGTFKTLSTGELLQVGDEARIIVTGMGNYTGTCSGYYKIYDREKDISKLFIVIDPQDFDLEYGRESGMRPVLSNAEGAGDIHVYLSQSDMYYHGNEQNAYDFVQVVSYANNKKVGTASVTLRGVGQYGGLKTYDFQIQPKSVGIVGVTAVNIDSRYLKMSAKEAKQLTVSVVPRNADIPGDAKEWTVSWKSGDNNIATVDDKGVVTAGTKSGVTNITATVTDAKGKKISGFCEVFSNMNVIVVEAVPDSDKDQADVFNACITAANAANKGVKEAEWTTVWVLNGTYSIDVNAGKKINMKSNVKLHMEDKAILKALPAEKSDYSVVSFSGVHDATLEGGKIVGDRSSHSGSGKAGGHCISISDSSEVTIKDVEISNAWGDGIHVSGISQSYDRTVIDHCSIHNNRANNIAVVSGDGITIKQCTLKDHGTGNGLTIGVKGSSPVTDVKVEGGTIGGSVNYAMSIAGPAENLGFSKVTFSGNVNNAGGNAPKFKDCNISGELREINDSGYSKFKLADLDDATKATIGEGKHITKEEPKK